MRNVKVLYIYCVTARRQVLSKDSHVSLMGSLEALQNWCRIKCENYPNVKILNMSSSFRDGLAFCAIIHKHRPDLIDFHSLFKDNVFGNNQLAFGVAEVKLGIPPLMDPTDMVFMEVPDRLSVITYISQYYLFFNRGSYASPASLKVSHVGVPSPSHLLQRHPASPQSLQTTTATTTTATTTTVTTTKSQAGGQTGAGSQADRRRTSGVCSSCRQHVHLVQRHLVEGRLYHRSCFRCRVCSRTLLPGSYRKGRETDSLVCTHHWKANQNARADLSRVVGSKEHLAISAVQGVTSSRLGHTHSPSLSVCSTGQTESQERAVSASQGRDSRQELSASREPKGEERNTDQTSTSTARNRPKKPPPPCPPQPATGESPLSHTLSQSAGAPVRSQERETEAPDPCGSQGGVVRPVPAPRRTSAPPRPTPRTRPAEEMDSSSDTVWAAARRKSPPSPAGGGYKPKGAPWMSIVHPGPWTRLPPAAAPTRPAPRDFTSPLQGNGEWFWKKAPPTNPFGEEEDDDTSDEGSARQTAGEAADPSPMTAPGGGSPHLVPVPDGEDGSRGTSETVGGGTTNTSEPAGGLAGAIRPGTPEIPHRHVPGTDSLGDSAGENRGRGTPTDADSAGESSGKSGKPNSAGGESGLEMLELSDPVSAGVPEISNPSDLAGSVGLQDLLFARSVSEPVGLNICLSVLSTNGDEAGPSASDIAAGAGSVAAFSQACEENPLDRGTPPVGIPTSKTFQEITSARTAAPGHGFPLVRRKVRAEDHVTPGLQGEMGELNQQMNCLETRGVELERSLRGCQNHPEEEAMLVDWITLIHDKNKLVRRDTELVYLTKQQHLEDRQADVEYQLRCLLNRPESEWSQDDRSQEQKLMEELVSVIQQRDRIIDGLEQDRQREKEEDLLLEAMAQRKDPRKGGEKNQKKSKGTMNPLSVLKMLGHRTEYAKETKSKSTQKKQN